MDFSIPVTVMVSIKYGLDYKYWLQRLKKPACLNHAGFF